MGSCHIVFLRFSFLRLFHEFQSICLVRQGKASFPEKEQRFARLKT